MGDEEILDNYKLLVSNGASPVPIPIQHAAASLYDDEEHHIEACEHYDKNFEIVEKYLKAFLFQILKFLKQVSFYGYRKEDDEDSSTNFMEGFFTKSYAWMFYGQQK